MRIGVIGCGNICGIYLENLGRFDGAEVVAVADLDLDRANKVAEKYGISRAVSTEAALADRAIDLVLNLTVPKAHAEVSLAAIQAGKHVYCEKPLATNFDDGARIMEAAASAGVTVGCAPDTVLGAGIQTCREIIDSGGIGAVVGGNAFMLCPGHEGWHPSPEFYYEVGGGPMFDMGPYYLSALVQLIGPIEAVIGSTSTPRAKRVIGSEPKRGKEIDVETPTHIVSILEFVSGAIVQLTTSFDVQRSTLPNIELYGMSGSMVVPDPNGFGGPVRTFASGDDTWNEVDLTRPFAQNSRGVGVTDQVDAIANGRPLRASGDIGLHVLEAMEAILVSSERGTRIELETSPERPEIMPV